MASHPVTQSIQTACKACLMLISMVPYKVTEAVMNWRSSK